MVNTPDNIVFVCECACDCLVCVYKCVGVCVHRFGCICVLVLVCGRVRSSVFDCADVGVKAYPRFPWDSAD